MNRRLRYTAHALQRLGERGILRHWVDAAAHTRPICQGRRAIFVLSAAQLRQQFGSSFRAGLCVVVDIFRQVIVTVHWLTGGVQ